MADMVEVSKVVDEIVIDAVDWAIQAPLRDHFRDLPEADMKEILHPRMWESNSYQAYEDHKMLYEALEKSMAHDHTDQLLTDLAEARRKKKKRHDSPKTSPGSPSHQPPPPLPPTGSSGTPGASGASGSSQLPPPPPPPSTNQNDQSKSTVAPSSSKTAASAKYMAWTTTESRLKPSVSSIPEDLHMDVDSAPDEQVYSSDDEDIKHDHIPKVNLKQDWWKPLSEEDRPATPDTVWSILSSDMSVPTNNWASALASTYAPLPENSLLAQTGDMATFMDWYCKRQGLTELTQKDLEGPAFEIVKVFHPDVIHLQYQMEECHKLLTDQIDDVILRYNVSEPLPLGGPQGQVTIQSDFFFNKDLEYLRYGSKGSRPALSISKMKAAYYPDVGLEQMVPDQMWIEEECKYDVAVMYSISHWWFQRQRLYINKHTSEGDRIGVRTHMRILNVFRIEVFSLYWYDYMKKIVLRRADLQEHIIAERDFKYMYHSDFEDLYLLNLLGHLNHLPPKDKKILTTADATGFEYKHDFTAINSPRAVIFRDKYGVQMIMRFNEIYKFSDGTLQQIDEALDYKVKEFKVNRMNPGLNTQFWSTKDVDRSKEFMFSIQKWLKTRRIFLRTEMELVLEHTQQGTSNEVSVSAERVEELKRNVKIKGEKKAAPLRRRKKTGSLICCRFTWLLLDIEDKYHGSSDTLQTSLEHSKITSKDSCFISHGDHTTFLSSISLELVILIYTVGPHGFRGSRKDGDGDTSFQWSQFTTPCSHLMLLIKDIMTNERPTTQLLQL
ncbi:hypothetical protein Tco_0308342 [Tanacetum coccineum]